MKRARRKNEGTEAALCAVYSCEHVLSDKRECMEKLLKCSGDVFHILHVTKDIWSIFVAFFCCYEIVVWQLKASKVQSFFYCIQDSKISEDFSSKDLGEEVKLEEFFVTKEILMCCWNFVRGWYLLWCILRIAKKSILTSAFKWIYISTFLDCLYGRLLKGVSMSNKHSCTLLPSHSHPKESVWKNYPWYLKILKKLRSRSYVYACKITLGAV